MATGLRVVKRYTLHDPVYGAGVTAPPGWGRDWRTYRDSGTGDERREMVFFGDSTTYGSEGNYSYVQQVRNRAVAYGCADGGKGMFGAGEVSMTYDAPEVNGVVNATDWNVISDQFDSLIGQFFQSDAAGESMTLRFRSAAARLWYSDRPSYGSFTYELDGGAPVTVESSSRTSGHPFDKFIYLSGLEPDATHTIVITNLGERAGDTTKNICRVAFAPVNDVGLAVQKQATSGGTIVAFFHGGLTPYTAGSNPSRYQAPLGLVPVGTGIPSAVDGYATGNTVDTSYPVEARIKPIMAMFNLAFNDLTNQVDDNYSRFTEGIRKFAAACRAVGIDGIVSAGNSPVNSKWPTYGPAMYQAMADQAATEGLAFIDMWEPFGGALDYTGGTANPHLTKPQYVAQGNYLWDALLGV